MRVLSIDVGGTYIKSAILSEAKYLKLKKRKTRCNSLNSFLDIIAEIYGEAGEVDGIVVSMPGVLDEKTGYSYTGGSLFYIREVNLAQLIKERCGETETAMVNDAKACAEGELRCGALTHIRDAVIVTIGTAIGGAVILDRNIIRGRHNFAGEFSYILNSGAPSPGFSAWGSSGSRCIAELYTKQPNGAVTPEEVFSRAEAGDGDALKAIDAFCRKTAVHLVNLQCVIDPEVIAVGGGVSVQPLLMEKLRQAVKEVQDTYPQGQDGMPKICIEPCCFSDNTMGAYCMFMGRVAASLKGEENA